MAGLSVTVASIYGDCDDVETTRGLMNKALRKMYEKDGGLQVIGADWNCSPDAGRPQLIFHHKFTTRFLKLIIHQYLLLFGN